MKCFLFFGTTFANMKSIWKKIYILPHIATNNTYLRSFHYKILNRILFLNKRLFVFRMKSTPLCSFCNIEEETLPRIFSECVFVIYLWQLLAIFCFFLFFENSLILPGLTPQTALLGLWSDNSNHNEPIVNHFLLILKLHVCNSRENHLLNIMNLHKDIKEIKMTEYCLSSNSEKTLQK